MDSVNNDALSDSLQSDSPTAKKRKGAELSDDLEIELNEEAREISNTDESPEPFVFNQERARAAIVKCIVFDDITFRFAENVEFFQLINPEFEPISTKYVMQDIKKLYIVEKEVLLEYFKNFPGKISVSYRLWKSETEVFDYDHVSLTAHYIDSDYPQKPYFRLLSLLQKTNDRNPPANTSSSSKTLEKSSRNPLFDPGHWIATLVLFLLHMG